MIIKLGIAVAALVAIGVGLLPPLFARGALATDALNAARAASVAAESGGSPDAAAAHSVVTHAGVKLVSVKVIPGGIGPTVEVKVSETVHTFLDGIPGLKSWFHVVSSQQSQLGQ